MNRYSRRQILQASGAAAAVSLLQPLAFAQAPQRHYQLAPGRWRTFDVTTRVDIQWNTSATRVWLPVPAVSNDWQEPLDTQFRSNGDAKLTRDASGRATMLAVDFKPGQDKPFAEVTSRVRTRDRMVDWSGAPAPKADPDLAHWTQPTALIPTDGIVRETALQATKGAQTDRERAHRIYEWVVTNAYRDPNVRGCGDGDIKAMLETGNLGGKCADLNALFVGLCRSVGIPARDLYGVRVARSGTGYSQLGADPSNLSGAQHCRAEVYLPQHGWVAMDPADVTKVMRSETPQWIRSTSDPVVAPVERALFGSWEGNWIAWNSASDVVLPGAKQPQLGFFMYPVAENADGAFDSYSPEDFKYRITAVERSA